MDPLGKSTLMLKKGIPFFVLCLFISIYSCTPKTPVSESANSTPPTPENTTENINADIAKLQGKWLLKAIKFYPQDEIIVPTKDYFLEFAERKINFNMEVNDCFTKYKILSPSKILIVDTMGCTKKCCDKDISDKLQYNTVNTYMLKNDKLTLQSDNKKFEFTRVSAVK